MRLEAFAGEAVGGGGGGGWRLAAAGCERLGQRLSACGGGDGRCAFDAERLRDARGEGAEFHFLQEGEQGLGIGVGDAELFQRDFDGDVVLQRDEDFREARLVGVLDQGLAALGLLDLAGARQQGFEVAEFVDQQGGSLDADAGNAGYVVDAVAAERLHVDHLVRRHAELLVHFRRADLPVLHGVQHADLVGDQLHQVFVRRHDGDARALGGGLARVGRDQVVGFKTLHLEGGLAEGDGGLAHQRELRDQVFRRIGAVGLVLVVEVIAEGDARRRRRCRRSGSAGRRPSGLPAPSRACCRSPRSRPPAGRRTCASAGAGRDRRGR